MRGLVRPPSRRKTGCFADFPKEVPESDVHGGDRGHANAFAAERHRFAIHVLPEEFDVPGIGADE
jgi:hypothetical protein